MKKSTRIRRILRDKSNWSSLVILCLALASAAYSFFAPDNAYSEKALSLAVGLITLEFFVLVIVHLEDIQGALKRLEEREPKGPQLSRWDKNKTGEIIEDAKDELFFCGYDLTRLVQHRAELLAASDKVKRVRLLAMDIENELVYEQIKSSYCREPSSKSLEHLSFYTTKQNIEVRTVKFPVSFAIHISGRDMQTSSGYMRILFLKHGSNGYDSPCVELTPADNEWYEFYKDQIEQLWEQGTSWEPKLS